MHLVYRQNLTENWLKYRHCYHMLTAILDLHIHVFQNFVLSLTSRASRSLLQEFSLSYQLTGYFYSVYTAQAAVSRNVKRCLMIKGKHVNEVQMQIVQFPQEFHTCASDMSFRSVYSLINFQHILKNDQKKRTQKKRKKKAKL